MEPKLLTSSRFVNKDIGCSYRYIQSDTEYFRPHYHDYYEIFIILSGQAYHLVNGEKLVLSEHELVFIRPKDIHDYISVNGRMFSMLNITFTAATAKKIFSFLGDGFPSTQLLSEDMPPSKLLSAAEFSVLTTKMSAIQTMPEGDISALKTALRVLLLDVFVKHFSVFSPKTTKIPVWLDEICYQMQCGGYIEGTKKLYALTDKSREHICRSMKKYMGITVSEFINELRLNHIANMLKNSTLPITDIVYSSGFNNLSWAAEQFKRKYSMNMRDYRNKK